MTQLLKIEWLKLKNYKAFWIFLGLYVLGLFSINYIVYQFQMEFKKTMPLEIFAYGFPTIYQTVSWISSWLLYFPGMLMILIISNEYTFKTHRQNIIDGLTRKQFVVSKILVAILIALITSVIVFLNAVGFGSAFSGTFSFSGVEFIGYSFIQSLCYLFFAMILAILLRRSGLAMAIFFLYGLIFEQLIGGFVDNKILNSHNFWYYMPLEASDVLVPSTLMKDVIYKNAPQPWVMLIICVVYIIAYCFFSIRKFERDDL